VKYFINLADEYKLYNLTEKVYLKNQDTFGPKVDNRQTNNLGSRPTTRTWFILLI